MTSFLRSAVAEALALVLPIACAGCVLDDVTLCDSCRAELAPDVTVRTLPDGTPVYAGLEYDGVVRLVLLALKEQQRTDLAAHLVPALGAAVTAAVDAAVGGVPNAGSPLQLVAVPGSRAAYRRRGYDPVRLLLGRTGLRARRVFAPARPHRVQKGLDIEARGANLSGVFRLRRAVDGDRILLIDDVVTTGSTLVEAARVLRAGGADVVGAATVASTPRRFASGVGESSRLGRHPADSDDLHSRRSVTSREGRTSVAEKARNSTA